MATWWTLGCDAEDPHRLAAFWAQALGYVPEPGYDYPDGASVREDLFQDLLHGVVMQDPEGNEFCVA
jgi:hypothetical protein